MPHAAGGMIVSAAGGYVAGTYLSTAAIGSLLAMAAGTLGVGAAALTGAASAIVGSAGIFGTTIGASGLTGLLMSAGILPATPVIVPVAIGGAALVGAYGSYAFFKLGRKVRATREGEEARFTPAEARIVQVLVKRVAKKSTAPPKKSRRRSNKSET